MNNIMKFCITDMSTFILQHYIISKTFYLLNSKRRLFLLLNFYYIFTIQCVTFIYQLCSSLLLIYLYEICRPIHFIKTRGHMIIFYLKVLILRFYFVCSKNIIKKMRNHECYLTYVELN